MFGKTAGKSRDIPELLWVLVSPQKRILGRIGQRRRSCEGDPHGGALDDPTGVLIQKEGQL